MSAEHTPDGLGDPADGSGREARRLQALRRLGLLEAAREPAFEALAATLQRLLAVPMSTVVVVGSDTLHVWNSEGQVAFGIARQNSLTEEIVRTGRMLVMGDARRDPHFSLHPNVARQTDPVVSYVGIPLKTSCGQVIGALCAIDYVPRDPPDPSRVALLEILARSAVTVLELRASRADHERVERELSRRKDILATIFENIEQGASVFSPDGRLLACNQRDLEIKGWRDEAAENGPDMMEACLRLARLGLYGPGDPSVLAEGRVGEFRSMMRRHTGPGSATEPLEVELRDGRTLARRNCVLDDGVLLLLRDTTEQRRRERQLVLEAHHRAMESGVAALANAAARVPDAICCLTEFIAREAGFDLAHASRLTPEGLRSLGMIYRRAEDDPSLSSPAVTAGVTGASDLATLALATNGLLPSGPVLRPGALGDLEPFRAQGGGLMAGVAFAIRTQRDTFVMEFFDGWASAREPWLGGLVSSLGDHIAVVDDRERAEQTKSELIATISHELRTPLTAMAGMIELLQSGLFGTFPPDVEIRLAHVAELSRGLGHMVEAMLRAAPVDGTDGGDPSGAAPLRLVA